MNITTECIIECELLYEAAVQYIPLQVLVVTEEYVNNDEKKNIFHYFEVKILKHLSDHRYNNNFPIGKIVCARAGDLYNGKIISYPDNYEVLVAEKYLRKLRISEESNNRYRI